MPDKDGLLSSEEHEKIKKWLDEKVDPHFGQCPYSGHKSWYVIGHLVYPLRYASQLIVGGPAYPQVMVACTECGFTMFFNAVKIGIAPWHGEKNDG